MGNIFAVAGASSDTSKYWFKIYKDIKKAGMNVYCVNPRLDKAEGYTFYHSLKDLPEKADTLIIVIRPDLTTKLVEEAVREGIKTIWFQPGTYDEEAVKIARKNGIEVHDACFMVQNGLW